MAVSDEELVMAVVAIGSSDVACTKLFLSTLDNNNGVDGRQIGAVARRLAPTCGEEVYSNSRFVTLLSVHCCHQFIMVVVFIFAVVFVLLSSGTVVSGNGEERGRCRDVARGCHGVVV